MITWPRPPLSWITPILLWSPWSGARIRPGCSGWSGTCAQRLTREMRGAISGLAMGHPGDSGWRCVRAEHSITVYNSCSLLCECECVSVPLESEFPCTRWGGAAGMKLPSSSWSTFPDTWLTSSSAPEGKHISEEWYLDVICQRPSRSCL